MPSGGIRLNRHPTGPSNEGVPLKEWKLPNYERLQLPCGTCIGCRSTRAMHWALRCRLEAAEHRDTCVTTLTYDEHTVPPTLQVEHLQKFMRRLRKKHKAKVRYFGCGEYGETFGRPHYHAILFGVRHEARFRKDTLHPLIQDVWPFGITYTDNVSIPAINYVAGYTTKKIGWPRNGTAEMIDPETGELFTWQNPFQVMSRKPGIGATARKHYQSWARYAVNDGAKISVPRFYKDAYKNQATPNEQEENDFEKYKFALTRQQLSESQLATKEKLHRTRNKLFHEAIRNYE